MFVADHQYCKNIENISGQKRSFSGVNGDVKGGGVETLHQSASQSLVSPINLSKTYADLDRVHWYT
jgi:hypothetical protein